MTQIIFGPPKYIYFVNFYTFLLIKKLKKNKKKKKKTNVNDTKNLWAATFGFPLLAQARAKGPTSVWLSALAPKCPHHGFTAFNLLLDFNQLF